MSNNLHINILALSLLAQFALYFSDHGMIALLLSFTILAASLYLNHVSKDDLQLVIIMSVIYALIWSVVLFVMNIASLTLTLMSGVCFASQLIWWHQGLHNKAVYQDLITAYHWIAASAIVLLFFACVLPCENMIMAQYYDYSISVRLSMIIVIGFIYSPCFVAYGYARHHKYQYTIAS